MSMHKMIPIDGFSSNADKIEYIRILHQAGKLLDLLPFIGKHQDTCLIALKGQPSIQQRIYLSVEFAIRPTGIDPFSLVKSASLRYFYPKEYPIVGPGQF